MSDPATRPTTPGEGAPVALVTGCSSGFGLLTAVALAAAGHHVVATVRSLDRARGLEEAASVAGVSSRLEVAVVDVAHAETVDAVVERIIARHGRLDVVVNNAGVEVRGPIDAVSDAEARFQFEANVFGLLNVVRATVPHLRRSRDAVIVNVGSIAGIIARPFAGIYAASKHAVEAITEAMHFELGLDGIRVHVVEPGQFPTSLATNTVTAAAFGPDHRHRAVADVVEERAKALVPEGEPADPAAVAVAIVAAVGDPSTPLRIPVGGDTALILAARTGNSFEDYEVLMRSALDYWEGYRPRGAEPNSG